MNKLNQKYGLWILTYVIFISTSFCSGQKKVNMSKNKTKYAATNREKHIISSPIVTKNFVKKNGEVTTNKEFYIQRSTQDYYIKFCESKISREELEKHLATINGFIKTVTMEVEFLDGYWDICDSNYEQQSRKGEYVIIHRIIKN